MKRTRLAPLLGLAAVVGCRLDPEPSRTPVCLEDGSGTATATVGDACVVVVASDFVETGLISRVVDGASTCTGEPALDPRTTVSSDVVLRVDRGVVLALTRYPAPALARLDPETLAVLWERALPEGSNPSDVVVTAQGTAVVSLYGTGQPVQGGELLEVTLDPAQPLVLAQHALTDFTEADGNPDVIQLTHWQGRVLALLQGLDAYPGCTADGRGSLVALDEETLEPTPIFDGAAQLFLRGCNPYAMVVGERNGQPFAAVAVAGRLRWAGIEADDGGIEWITLTTGRSEGLLVTESQAGGADFTELALDTSTGRLWTITATADFSTAVREVRPTSGAPLGSAVYLGTNIFDVFAHEGRLWMADRDPRGPAVVTMSPEDPAAAQVLPGPLPPLAFASTCDSPGR